MILNEFSAELPASREAFAVSHSHEECAAKKKRLCSRAVFLATYVCTGYLAPLSSPAKPYLKASSRRRSRKVLLKGDA